MDVNIKNIILSILIILTAPSADNINSKVVLNFLEKKVKDSKKELSLRLSICFDIASNNSISISDMNFLKNFKRKDVFAFASHIYIENLNNCMQKKDQLYMYNLTMLYSAQKDYDMDTTDTLKKITSYFEPIEGLEHRINYINAPQELKEYLKKRLGNKIFNYSKTMKNIFEHYRTMDTAEAL